MIVLKGSMKTILYLNTHLIKVPGFVQEIQRSRGRPFEDQKTYPTPRDSRHHASLTGKPPRTWSFRREQEQTGTDEKRARNVSP